MSSPRPDRQPFHLYWLASILFFCSGATGLAYEVIWFKRFSHVWGNSTLATATVVASFLSGLGLGARWLGRFADRVSSPLRWYGALELGIGVLALLVPLLAQAMVTWIVPAVAPLHAYPLAHALVRFGLTFAVIGPPCILMGGTLPLLVRQFGATAWLYAVNTLGAALGCYLAGFHLLPSFGLTLTNAGAAALNVSIALVVWATVRPATVAGGAEATPEPKDAARPSRTILLASALTGAAALMLQLVWSRQLAVILGGSTYAFSAMLVVILVGIGIGSVVLHLWLRDPWLRDRHPTPVTAAAVVAFTMVTAVLGQWAVPMLVDVVGAVTGLRGAQGLNAFISVMASTVLELLPGLGMGILFPLLVALTRSGSGPSGASVGAVYAWNTFGTIAGAVATPLLLMPALGAAGAVTVAVGVYAAALLVLVLPGGRGGLWRLVLPAVAVASVVVSTGRWNADPRDAYLGAYIYGVYTPKDRADREVLSFRDGSSASVLVVRLPGGELSLHVNGKIDATSVHDMPTQLGLAYLPRFLRPHARDVLVIGLGSGTTAGASLLFPDTRVTAVEIEPAIVDAARLFGDVNHRPEESAAFRLVVDDGRNFLQGAADRYDLILSEPSNPWIAGVSNLFTREFYDVARRRLKPDGVLAQWIQTYALDPKDYALILRTVLTVFPEAALFRISASDTILIASESALDGDAGIIRDGQGVVDASPAIQGDLQRYFGTTHVLDLMLARLLLDRAGVTRAAAVDGDSSLNTDVNQRLEFDAPRRLFGAGHVAEINRALFAAADPRVLTGTFERWGGRPEQAGVFHEAAFAFVQSGQTAGALTLSAYGYALAPDAPALAGDVYALSPELSPEDLERLGAALVAQSPVRAARLGSMLVRGRKPERALAIFERLTKLHPDSATQWKALADAYRAVGRPADAANAIRSAYALDPFDESVADAYKQLQQDD